MASENIIPRLYVKSAGEQTTKLSLQLTRVERKCVVRITGGCGKMSPEETDGMYRLFAEAFRGFDGAMIFGGTRMLRRDDRKTVVPGITEVPWELRDACPGMTTLGIIPRTSDLGIADEGMLIEDGEEDPYFTIVHPHQDIVLVVQVSADDAEVWDAEYRECLRITKDLREFAGFSSVLISFNGGTVTSREIEAVAERAWPVILVRDSGRATDRYAADEAFLASHPSVMVADRDPASLRRHLSAVNAVPRRLELVRDTRSA